MPNGFIITRTLNAGSSSSFGSKSLTVSIPAGETRDIDITPFTTYVAAKWMVTVVDAGHTLLQSYEVRGHYLAGAADTVHNISSHLGNNIHNTVSLAINASNLVLRVTNNESYAIEVKTAKYDVVS